MKKTLPPVALTIAGSDSCGGAGVQMDLKIFAALEVYGASVITAVTAQNSVGVRDFKALSAKLVDEQLGAVLDDLPVGAAKTGMLWSGANVRAVAAHFAAHPQIPLVVDPVIWAKDSSRLLSEQGAKVLVNELFPLAALVTPNLGEVASICGLEVTNTKEARLAAERFISLGARAVLIKGGHLPGSAVDVLFDGCDFFEFKARRRTPAVVHGTGCALSAAITAFLARGYALHEAVAAAHNQLQKYIHRSVQLGQGSQLLFPVAESQS